MSLPRLYRDLALWWPPLSHPDEYADEAAWIFGALKESLGRPPGTILELGSGGGNTASHLTPHARLTLVDLSAEMLAVSRFLNPLAEHVEGDMRAVRLGRLFDAVLIHDAIMYMTAERDLVAALATARAHLGASGVAIVLPDCTAESFAPGVDSGGRDAADGRGVRYLEWSRAPAVGATSFEVDYAILLRAPDGTVEAVLDRHQCGLFPRRVWRSAFGEAGFGAPLLRTDPWGRDVFVARPAPAR